MKLSPEKLSAVYVQAALEEIAEKYESEGYEVSFEGQLSSSLRADMIAKKGDETILIEAVLYPNPLFKSHVYEEKIKQLREAAKQIPGAKVRLVLITPPETKQIQIDGIEEKLTTYLTDNPPSELDDLASRVYIEEVTDVEIQAVETHKEGMRLVGYATISVKLAYGPSHDQSEVNESYPMTFDIVLDASQDIQEINSLSVDTATFYE